MDTENGALLHFSRLQFKCLDLYLLVIDIRIVVHVNDGSARSLIHGVGEYLPYIMH